MNVSRRKLLGAAAIAQAIPIPAQSRPWNPTLGILGNFSESNVRFAKEAGFSSIGLLAHPKTTLDLSGALTEQRIEQVRTSIKNSGLRLSVIGCHLVNHIATDAAERARGNEQFVRAIELAG